MTISLLASSSSVAGSHSFSLAVSLSVTVYFFFSSSFSDRGYSREVAPSSRTGGWVEGEGGIFTSRARRGTHTYTRTEWGREETGVGEVTEVIARCGTSVAPKRCSLGVCGVRNYSTVSLSLPVYLPHQYSSSPLVSPSISLYLSLSFSLSLLLATLLLCLPLARQKVPPTPFAGRVTGSLDHASCTARTTGTRNRGTTTRPALTNLR